MLRVPLGVGFLVFDHDAQAASRVLELEALGDGASEREREELAAVRSALEAAGYVRHTVTTRTRRTSE